MDSGFRELAPRETGLLEKLLEGPFPGRDELRAQLGSLTARQAHEDGTLILRCGTGPPAATTFRVVAEAMYKDDDGGEIAVLLHVTKDGFLHMLEIVKYDGSPIIHPPSARDLTVLLPQDKARE